MRISELGAWPGGTVLDLATAGDAAAGDIVLAATFTGILRSEDAGTSWQPVQADLPDWFIQAVALAESPGGTVGLAASRMGWLYRSTDGGATWAPISDTRDLGGVTRLIVSPTFVEDGIVFACTEEDGVFKSTDRGRTWKSANFGLLNLNVMTLGFSPGFAHDEVLFCGTDGGGLFRSRNAGRAWRESGAGLPNSAVQCLAVSPGYVEDGTVLAGTEDRGLYLSTDKGYTWTPVGDLGPEACINALYLAPGWKSGGMMLAATDGGLCVSADGGAHWETVQGGPEYPYAVTRGPGGYLAGAYDGGVYRSPDGLDWETSNQGLAAHLPPLAGFSRAFDSDRCLVLGSMEGALVRSTDAGATWTAVPGPGDEWGAFSLLAGSGSGEAQALLVASGVEAAYSGDAGASWRFCAPPATAQISALALTGSGSGVDNGLLVGTASGQVLASTDGGASWQTREFPDRAQAGREMIVALASEGTSQAPSTYVVTALPLESGLWQLVLKLGASGSTLATCEAAQPAAQLTLAANGWLFCALHERVVCLQGGQVRAESRPFESELVTGLAAAGDVLWAGSRAGLCRSADGGHTWETVSSELAVVALHAAGPERVYAVTMGGRLWEIER